MAQLCRSQRKLAAPPDRCPIYNVARARSHVGAGQDVCTIGSRYGLCREVGHVLVKPGGSSSSSRAGSPSLRDHSCRTVVRKHERGGLRRSLDCRVSPQTDCVSPLRALLRFPEQTETCVLALLDSRQPCGPRCRPQQTHSVGTEMGAVCNRARGERFMGCRRVTVRVAPFFMGWCVHSTVSSCEIQLVWIKCTRECQVREVFTSSSGRRYK